MLLPHGYEGQGPEHSSARVERFLQLCGEDNLQIVNCTTPAQYFHVLRRQMRRNFRTPLIIFTPKSLLRAPRAASRSEALASGSFQRLIDDARALAAPERVRRVLLCCGKVYYDLLEAKEKREAGGAGAGEVALVRVEQLYPWPAAQLASSLERYARADRVFWVQEEPSNMGAWTFVRERIQDALHPSQQLAYAGRAESASTAVGSLRLHKEQQGALVAAAFSGLG